MKPLWRTAIILTAIAGAMITAILIFLYSTPSPAVPSVSGQSHGCRP
ncbi:MAG: hypothetical protein V7L01_34540 [Nostoc sp.]